MQTNTFISTLLDELADLLEAQHANVFRILAYRRAAAAVRDSRVEMHEILRAAGEAGLRTIDGIGDSIAHAIERIDTTGRLPMLDRLRGETAPDALLEVVPTIGRALARRIQDELGIVTIAHLAEAVASGRVAAVDGLGAKRLRALADFFTRPLASKADRKLGDEPEPSVDELLDVDAEFRERADCGELPTIIPRRNNPAGDRRLPLLHTTRGTRHYTVMFSNTARAHALGRTRDWVVILRDDHARGQWTVVSSQRGGSAGRRVVRGREKECAGADRKTTQLRRTTSVSTAGA